MSEGLVNPVRGCRNTVLLTDTGNSTIVATFTCTKCTCSLAEPAGQVVEAGLLSKQMKQISLSPDKSRNFLKDLQLFKFSNKIDMTDLVSTIIDTIITAFTVYHQTLCPRDIGNYFPLSWTG